MWLSNDFFLENFIRIPVCGARAGSQGCDSYLCLPMSIVLIIMILVVLHVERACNRVCCHDGFDNICGHKCWCGGVGCALFNCPGLEGDTSCD